MEPTTRASIGAPPFLAPDGPWTSPHSPSISSGIAPRSGGGPSTNDDAPATADFASTLQPNTPRWWAKIGFGIAILVGLAAPIAAVAAQYSMGASWRIGVDPQERTDLITDGAFRPARNPIFTAMLITATGLAMTIPNIVSLIGLVALVAALEIQVRLVEEPYVVHTHGDQH